MRRLLCLCCLILMTLSSPAWSVFGWLNVGGEEEESTTKSPPRKKRSPPPEDPKGPTGRAVIEITGELRDLLGKHFVSGKQPLDAHWNTFRDLLLELVPEDENEPVRGQESLKNIFGQFDLASLLNFWTGLDAQNHPRVSRLLRTLYSFWDMPCDARLGDEHATLIGQCARRVHIKNLDSKNLRALRLLLTHSGVRHLRISGNLDAIGFQIMMGLMRSKYLPRILTLHFDRFPVPDDKKSMDGFLRMLASQIALEKLIFDHMALTDEQALAIAGGCVELEKIQRVEFLHNGLSPKARDTIFLMKKKPGLQLSDEEEDEAVVAEESDDLMEDGLFTISYG